MHSNNINRNNNKNNPFHFWVALATPAEETVKQTTMPR